MNKTLLILSALFVCTTAMAADFTGTWRLNVERSNIQTTALASETMKIEATGPNTYRTTIDGTSKSGATFHEVRNRVYDGHEHVIEDAGAPPNATETCEIGTAGRRKITLRQDGKVIAEVISTISADGKTLTNVRTVAKGKDTLVFDRQ